MTLWQERWIVLDALGSMKSWDYGSSRERALIARLWKIDAVLFPESPQ